MIAAQTKTASFDTLFLNTIVEKLREMRRRRAVYARTVGELSTLSHRDLMDIGIDRGDIATVARQAAKMA